MTQTRLEELPLEDLQWELDNRLDAYMHTNHRWGTAVIDEASIQLEDNGFQVEATCVCARCGTEVRLEIGLQPTPKGKLLRRLWTLHTLRPKSHPGVCRRRRYEPEPDRYEPDLDKLRAMRPPGTAHRWGVVKIIDDSRDRVKVISVCEICGAEKEYHARWSEGRREWWLGNSGYRVPKKYKESECYKRWKAQHPVAGFKPQSEIPVIHTETEPGFTPPLEERAENLPPSTLQRMGSIDERAVFRLTDHLANDLRHPLFMLGPKGIGKTYAVLKALNRRIREEQAFLPLMFIYRRNNTFELLSPMALADPEDWGEERLGQLESLDLKELLERVDAIVMDDLHYRLEAVLDGETSLGLLVDDLKLILELVETGKKVILVSEMPLAYYGDIIEDEELDEVLARYNQVPYRIRGQRRRELMRKGTPVSVFEILPVDYGTWARLWDTYGFDAQDAVMQVIYHISDKRSWITGLITKMREDPNLVEIHIHSDGVDIIPKWAPGSVFDRENMKKYEATMERIKAPWNDSGARWELRDLIPVWVNPQDGCWETDTDAFYVTREELRRHNQSRGYT